MITTYFPDSRHTGIMGFDDFIFTSVLHTPMASIDLLSYFTFLLRSLPPCPFILPFGFHSHSLLEFGSLASLTPISVLKLFDGW